MAGTKKEPHRGRDGPSRASTPTRDVDLSRAALPDYPEALRDRCEIIAQIRAYVRRHTQAALDLKRECERVIDEERPASTERTLTAGQAAKRIGVNRVRVVRLAQSGRLGAVVDGRMRFSEEEADRYRDSDRKPGRPRKNSRSH